MFSMYIDFHMFPLPVPWGFFFFFFFFVLFGIIIWSPLKVDSNSNLGSFFYETVYDAASIIDYSKEPLNAGIVDSPPPKQRCWQSRSLSPLKRTSRNCIQSSHSWPGDSIPPQRGLWMDAQPTHSVALPIPLRNALSLPANSNASANRAKVTPPPSHG
jgi:hypothetical protein